MAVKIGDDLLLMGFALRLAKADPQSSDPTLVAGDEARFWYNSTSKKFKFWNGTAAIDMTDLANSTGSLTASRISDFMTQVVTARLNQFLAPNADIPMAGFKFTGMADGVAGSDGATYGQLLQLVNNQLFKPARVATTAQITRSGTQTIDGVAVVAGDRVLDKDDSTAAARGIYVVAAGAWTRATDADSATELPPGTVVTIAEGTANGDKLFMNTTNGPITIGTTALTFSAYGAASGEIGVAGQGLTKTGTTYDVVAGSTGTVSVIADAVDVNTARVPRKWVGTIPTSSGTVDGIGITVAAGTITFNHGAGNKVPEVIIRAGSSPASGYTAGEKVLVGGDVPPDNNNARIVLPGNTTPATNNWDFMVIA